MANGIDPRQLAARAAQLEQAGRFAEAELAYRQLLSAWPQLADSWYNLGRLQRRLGKFREALTSYAQALDRGISQPEEVHLNRGVVYSDGLQQYPLAEQELNTALRLNPDYVPALFNLANLHEDFGRRDAAIALYERLLAIEPGHHEALARYAGVRLPQSADDPLLARLRAAIASHDASVADKASLGFALGRALDAVAEYDAAFAAYVQANRDSRTLSPANTILYDRRRQERFVDELIAAFGVPAERTSPALPRPRPIFICGMFRSGSTLTEQVLAAHSQVTAGGELNLLPALTQRELAPFPAALARTDESQLRVLAQRYQESLRQRFGEAACVTDKRPDNFLYIGLIKRLFPDAKIVHTTRHALDNCLSIFFLHLDHGMGYALDLMDIAHYYTQYRRLMQHWQALFPGDILDFEYDTFVREPRAATQRLLEFCDLPWEDACLSFERTANAVRTASVWQVRQSVYRQSSGRWRNYAAQLEPVRAYLREAGFYEASTNRLAADPLR